MSRPSFGSVVCAFPLITAVGCSSGGPGMLVGRDAAQGVAETGPVHRDGGETGVATGKDAGRVDASLSDATAEAAEASHEASVDAAVEASTDGSRHPDTGTTSASDAAADAVHDGARKADASDAGGHGCTYTGMLPGTMDTLARAASTVIEDFDIDCDNVFFTAAGGKVLSCPASGCTAAPTTVLAIAPTVPQEAGADLYASTSATTVRIGGPKGVVVGIDGTLAPKVDSGGAYANSGFGVYAMARDGSQIVLLTQTLHEPGIPAGFSLEALSAVGTDVYVVSLAAGNSRISSLTTLVPGADAGVTTIAQCNDQGGQGNTCGFAGGFQALVGSTVYSTLGFEFGQPTIVNAAPGGPVFANQPPVLLHAGYAEFTASNHLVACAGEILGDGGVNVEERDSGGCCPRTIDVDVDAGGASGFFVCAAGATCPSPTRVTGFDATKISALYSDATTIYFTDASNDLFSCDGATALAGTCAPTALALPAPSFAKLQGDADNVYLLKSDGSAIVRIAK